jgi:hypothetical protein
MLLFSRKSGFMLMRYSISYVLDFGLGFSKRVIFAYLSSLGVFLL